MSEKFLAVLEAANVKAACGKAGVISGADL